MIREGKSFSEPELAKRQETSFFDIQNDLTSVLASQREFLSRDEPDLPPQSDVDESAFGCLSEPQRAAVKQNIRLLSLLSGHQGSILRRQLEFIETSSAFKLTQLVNWSNTVIRTGTLSFTEVLTISPSHFLTEVKNARELYEFVLGTVVLDGEDSFNSKNISDSVHRHLGLTPGKNYAQVTHRLFSEGSKILGTLLNTVGFIPHQLYEDSSFRALEPRQVIAVEQQLREIQRSDLLFSYKAREERAQLTQALFTSGIAKKLRTGGKDARYVTLDSNGVRIHFDGRLPGKGKPL